MNQRNTHARAARHPQDTQIPPAKCLEARLATKAQRAAARSEQLVRGAGRPTRLRRGARPQTHLYLVWCEGDLEALLESPHQYTEAEFGTMVEEASAEWDRRDEESGECDASVVEILLEQQPEFSRRSWIDADHPA